MKNGNVLPKNEDITKQERADNSNKGNKAPNELSKAQKRFRHIREDIYKIGRDKLAGEVGLYDGSTIKNYETKPGYNISIDTLIKCADYLSSIPDKNGNINHISLDYLLDRTSHTSMNCESINEITGLSDVAINRLKSLNESDIDRMIYNGEHLLDKYTYLYPIRLTIINFMLQSKSLEVLCDTFQEYIKADCYTDFIADIGDNMGYVNKLFATNESGLLKPIKVSELLNKANVKRALDILLDNLVNEWNNQSGFDVVRDCPELFESFYKLTKQEGYEYSREEAAEIFREVSKESITKDKIEKVNKLLLEQLRAKQKK